MKLERCTGTVVKAVTPYDEKGSVDLEAFRRYLSFVTAKGAKSVLLFTDLGDGKYLSQEEKEALVHTAAETAGEKAMVIATLLPGDLSIKEQTVKFLNCGADAVNLQYPASSEEELKANVKEAEEAGAEYIVVTDFKSGGFDMNFGGRGKPVGLNEDWVISVFNEIEAFKSVILSVPLNVCNQKCTKLTKGTDSRLNVIADTATDQFLEQTDRGAEGFTTGILVSTFNRIYTLFTSGNVEEARKIFFKVLRVIVWTKQYVDREPYLYQLYLQDQGLLNHISYRTERYIDEYMVRYGKEMAELAEETEKECE